MEDRQLIKRIQQGESELLNLLIQSHYKSIYAFCYRRIGDATAAYDLTQEVFLRLVRYIDTYEYRDSFRNYLFSIAVNVCNDYFRKEYGKEGKIVLSSYEELKEQVDDCDAYEGLERTEMIKSALDSLPDIQKEAVILRYYHDLKVRDIAKILGIGISTTKSRIRQGVKRLKEQFREEDVF